MLELCSNDHDELCYDSGTLMNSNQCPACKALDELAIADDEAKDRRATLDSAESHISELEDQLREEK